MAYITEQCKSRLVPELWCNINSVHVFDDLDVLASANVSAAASAAKLHFTLLVLHVFLLLLYHSHLLLHYSLNLKLEDLMKGKNITENSLTQECGFQFSFLSLKRTYPFVVVCLI